MSHRRAKKIRKLAFKMKQSLVAEPYTKVGGQTIASENRRIYQILKKQKGAGRI